MEVLKTEFEGLFIIKPRIFEDERGHFFESYNDSKLETQGLSAKFVQDNQSFSKKGVLRGLHLQKEPYAQGKLVRVLSGKVLDVAVDLRKSSKTYGAHFKYLLDDEKKEMMYIPEGFAHGFITLEDAVFFYKCTNLYHKESESGIIWNDADLNIDWEVEDPIISQKDLELPSFKDF